VTIKTRVARMGILARSPNRLRWLLVCFAGLCVGCAPAASGALRAPGVPAPGTSDAVPLQAGPTPGGASASPSASPSAAAAAAAERAVSAAPGSAPQSGRSAASGPAGSVCGTWAMLQVSTSTALKWFTPSINQALAMPGIQGLSLRAPWTSIAPSLSIFAGGLQITRAAHVNLAIRFVAGEDTPAQFLGNSTVLQGSGGRHIPLPWGAGSTPTSFIPNTTFVAAYKATVDQLAAYARANGIRELHLPWYSGPTAEIYLGPEIQSAPGYSLQNFLDGYEQLINVAMSVAGNGLTVELPMSGIGTGQLVHPLEQYIVSRYGSDPKGFIAQWNDLGNGQPKIAAPGLATGRQMAGQGDFNWSAAYATLRAEGSTTLEVYLQSFAPGLPHFGQLRQDIASFSATC
jgi:hypothetical protein